MRGRDSSGGGGGGDRRLDYLPIRGGTQGAVFLLGLVAKRLWPQVFDGDGGGSRSRGDWGLEPEPVSSEIGPNELVGYLQTKTNAKTGGTMELPWCVEHGRQQARARRGVNWPIRGVAERDRQQLLVGLACSKEDCCVEW